MKVAGSSAGGQRGGGGDRDRRRTDGGGSIRIPAALSGLVDGKAQLSCVPASPHPSHPHAGPRRWRADRRRYAAPPPTGSPFTARRSVSVPRPGAGRRTACRRAFLAAADRGGPAGTVRLRARGPRGARDRRACRARVRGLRLPGGRDPAPVRRGLGLIVDRGVLTPASARGSVPWSRERPGARTRTLRLSWSALIAVRARTTAAASPAATSLLPASLPLLEQRPPAAGRRDLHLLVTMLASPFPQIRPPEHRHLGLLHLPVQSDGTARGVRAGRVHRRWTAGRAADRGAAVSRGGRVLRGRRARVRAPVGGETAGAGPLVAPEGAAGLPGRTGRGGEFAAARRSARPRI